MACTAFAIVRHAALRIIRRLQEKELAFTCLRATCKAAPQLVFSKWCKPRRSCSSAGCSASPGRCPERLLSCRRLRRCWRGARTLTAASLLPRKLQASLLTFRVLDCCCGLSARTVHDRQPCLATGRTRPFEFACTERTCWAVLRQAWAPYELAWAPNELACTSTTCWRAALLHEPALRAPLISTGCPGLNHALL